MKFHVRIRRGKTKKGSAYDSTEDLISIGSLRGCDERDGFVGCHVASDGGVSVRAVAVECTVNERKRGEVIVRV